MLYSDWTLKSTQLMSANRIQINGRRYTAPAVGDDAPPVYRNQFLWDSCFHAIILRWLDPAMARDELLTLAAAQVQDGPDAGMIPHMIDWPGTSGQAIQHSVITQPPLIAIAAKLIYDVTGDRAVLEAIYDPVCALHDWFDRRRDPDHDGLVCLIHPWESGWDASPRWDDAMRLPDSEYETGRQARAALADTVVRYSCDAEALAQAGYFHVEPVDFNAIRAADLEALAQIAQVIDKPDHADHWLRKAEHVQRQVQAKMWREWPYDLAGPTEQPVVQPSAAQFITLFGGCVAPAQAEQLVRHLRKDGYWTTFPVPTTPVTESTFIPDRYWRGNVWFSVNWLICKGLRRYGYHELAAEVAQQTVNLVEKSGFWEYYHPLTGAGLGAVNYSWAALILDMLASEKS